MKLGVWKNWKIISWLRSITHADGNYAAEYSEVSKVRGVEYLGLRISNCEYSVCYMGTAVSPTSKESPKEVDM